MENKKVCPQCNAQQDKAMKFCQQCGYFFNDVMADEQEKVPAPTPTENTSDKMPTTPQAENMPSGMPTTPQTGNMPNGMPTAPQTGNMPNGIPTAPQMGNMSNGMPMNMSNPIGGGMTPPPANGNGFSPIPQENNKKKGKGGLVAVLTILIVLIVAVVVLILGVLFGWFEKEPQKMSLSRTHGKVEVDEEYEILIKNYEDLGSPEVTCEVANDRIVEVAVERGGILVVTGLEEGETEITITAKDCEDVIFAIEVEPGEIDPVIDIDDLQGTAWQAGVIQYYLMDDGTFYLICDEYNDYVRGTYSIEVMEPEDVYDVDTSLTTLAEDLEDLVDDGTYYDISCDVEIESLGGNITEGGDFQLILCHNGDEGAIFDSGWTALAEAEEIDMVAASDLDYYFDGSGSSSSGGSSAGTTTNTVDTGSIEGITFTDNGSVKETWQIAYDDQTDTYVVESDGDLYRIAATDLINGTPELLVDLTSEGYEVTVFAMYEGNLIYTAGSGTAAEELRMRSSDGTTSVLCDSFDVRDFIIYEDYIYCTDYTDLIRVDMDGNLETLWQWGVCTFEVDDTYIYIYDGNTWEALDVVSGEDLGYIVTGMDYMQEADIAQAAGDYLFYTTYDYNTLDITLYAQDLDGNIIQIGDGMWGETYDTYNAVYIDQYAFYTVDGAETLIRTDVTTGEQTITSFSNYGYYYVAELMNIEGELVVAIYDDYGYKTFGVIDTESLTFTEYEALAE